MRLTGADDGMRSRVEEEVDWDWVGPDMEEGEGSLRLVRVFQILCLEFVFWLMSGSAIRQRLCGSLGERGEARERHGFTRKSC